ncbi:MAG: transcription factor S [Candidatus Ranarchaeia archaeon]|jgi:DNA-directed RNA polymerase subunit M
MEFCANCGSLLKPRKTSKKTVVLFCAKCGAETKSSASKLQKEESYVLKSHIKHVPSDKIVIESEEINTQPTTFAECGKCGNTKAFTWQQSFSGGEANDEPEVTLFRCTKCNFTWREL